MDVEENVLMLKAACISAVVLLFAGLAIAQVPASGNVFIGYSFENDTSSALNNLSRPNLQGWQGSLEGKVIPWLGIVTDISGRYGSESFLLISPEGPINVSAHVHQYEALFGPRVSVPIGKITPFGEFMIGLAHIGSGGFPSNTSFATAVGGGIDYRLFRPIAWRVEGDYVRTNFFGTPQNDIRVSTGIVIRF